MAGRTVASGGGTDDAIHTSDSTTDRRRARSDRTRHVLVEAVIGMIAEGAWCPTAPEVARRAGVSVRTFYNQFAGIDALLHAAVELQERRHRSLVTFIPPHGPVDNRIRATCRQRRQLFETIGPVLAVAYTRTRAPAGFREALSDHRSRMRRQLARTLGPEIQASGGQARWLLSNLEMSTGWETWHSLRLHNGHTAQVAERMMAFTVASLLRSPDAGAEGSAVRRVAPRASR
ncbi:MAG: TetR/AcrR family transcriptional regulator [Acidimicrobiales bacterium]